MIHPWIWTNPLRGRTLLNVGNVRRLPARGREFFLGEDGSVLRATWHLDQDLVNLTVWRGQQCTESFQVPTADAARLIAFLADGLASATDARWPVETPTWSANVVRHWLTRG